MTRFITTRLVMDWSGRILERNGYWYDGPVLELKGNQQAKQYTAEAAAQRNQAFGQISGLSGKIAQLKDLIPSNLSPEQREAMLRASLGAMDIGTEAAQQKGLAYASRTGAVAGIPELLSQTERTGMQQKAAQQAKLQEYFANVPIQRAQEQAGILGAAAQPLASIYGPTAGVQTGMAQYAFRPSFLQEMLLAGAQGAGQAGSAMAMGG